MVFTNKSPDFMSTEGVQQFSIMSPHSFLNLKVLVGTFNKENAIVGSSSVIVILREPSFPALDDSVGLKLAILYRDGVQ